jgi:hypothetical protein
MTWHWSGEVVGPEVSVIIERLCGFAGCRAVEYDLKYGWQRLVVVRRGFFILKLGFSRWNRFRNTGKVRSGLEDSCNELLCCVGVIRVELLG